MTLGMVAYGATVVTRFVEPEIVVECELAEMVGM